MKVLDFGYEAEGVRNPVNWGNYYWAVGLPDGRECFVQANEVKIDDGALLVIGHYHKPRGRREHDERPYADWSLPCEGCDLDRTLMAFAPGAWTACYAASVIDGDPVAVDHLPEPATAYGRQAKMGDVTTITICYLCHQSLSGKVEMDHVLPRSKGGDDGLIMPVHFTCNRSKGNRPLMPRPPV